MKNKFSQYLPDYPCAEADSSPLPQADKDHHRKSFPKLSSDSLSYFCTDLSGVPLIFSCSLGHLWHFPKNDTYEEGDKVQNRFPMGIALKSS